VWHLSTAPYILKKLVDNVDNVPTPQLCA
jgi:hypothetical protein